MTSTGKESAATARARVLVVEDDASTSHALVLLLRHHGYDVTLAATVRDAMRHIAAAPGPEFILLDLMLPDGDGGRILEAVRAAGMDTRVVVVTGVGDTDRLAQVNRLGPAALLKKPVDFSQILENLSRVA
jgi:DNA-binding NtrC family response regulator